LWSCGSEQFHNFGPPHFFRPGVGCGPRLRVRLDGIGAAREKQLHHLDAPPPACPSERSTLEQFVADIEARSGIEQNGGELDAHPVIARECFRLILAAAAACTRLRLRPDHADESVSRDHGVGVQLATILLDAERASMSATNCSRVLRSDGHAGGGASRW